MPLVLGDLLRGLALLAVYFIVSSGHFNIYAIYALALFSGLAGTLYGPAASSLIPTLVPAGGLERANGLLGMASESMSLLGLLLGGVLVATIGTAPSLAVDGVTFLIMAALVTLINIPKRLSSRAKRGFWRDFTAGLKVIRGSRLLLLIPILAFFLNGAAAPLSVLIPLQMKHFGVGASGYGLFMGLFAGGALLGSTFVGVLGKRFKSLLAVGIGIAGFGGAMIGLALSQSFLFSLPWAVILGLGSGFAGIGIQILVQRRVEAEFLGRVFGVLGATGQAGQPLALFLLSGVIAGVSIASIYWVVAALSAFMALLWWWGCWSSAAPTGTAEA